MKNAMQRQWENYRHRVNLAVMELERQPTQTIQIREQLRSQREITHNTIIFSAPTE